MAAKATSCASVRPAMLARGALAALLMFGAVTGWAYARRAVLLRTPLPDAAPVADGCTIWFVGSSSIHKWDGLAAEMRPWSVRKRGVNGAMLDEIGQRFLSEAPGRPPAAVIFYAGENDIAEGATPRRTVDALLALVDAQRRRMPDVPVAVVALKPSPARWRMRPDQRAANVLLEREAPRHHAAFIRVGDELLVDGVPGPFYQPDGIHLDASGYRLWGRDVRRQLEAALPATLVHRCRSTAA